MDESGDLVVRFNNMQTLDFGAATMDLLPLFSFDPVSRRSYIHVLDRTFVHLVPLSMRANPHKYLVLQRFSNAYWFHLSYYEGNLFNGEPFD